MELLVPPPLLVEDGGNWGRALTLAKAEAQGWEPTLGRGDGGVGFRQVGGGPAQAGSRGKPGG